MPEPPPTSGPFVDALSRYWSDQGKADGLTLGTARGFNYGLRLIFGEVKKGNPPQPAEVPIWLVKKESDNHRLSFPCVPLEEPKNRIPGSPPAAKGPCLEQLWYDVGFELGSQEGYGPAIPQGMNAAYDFLRNAVNEETPRHPPPPANPNPQRPS